MSIKKWAVLPVSIVFLGIFTLFSRVSSEPVPGENMDGLPAQGGADFSGWYEKNSNYVRPSDEELKKKLTHLQYNVTRKDDTERPFQNEYWDNKQEGLYVDVISGEPLFSSNDKFKSGTGWPSFTRPVTDNAVVKHEDRSFFSVRTEVRGRLADSHLGHVFDDGPPPTGLRYCVNSASLRFIPKEKLEEEGYVEFLPLFEK